VVAAGAAAGAVEVWAEAVLSWPATSSAAARQIPVRSMGDSSDLLIGFEGIARGIAGRELRPAMRLAIRRS
jgi:hypothetical protein